MADFRKMPMKYTDDYPETITLGDDEEACARCGRTIKATGAIKIFLCDGGDAVLHPDDVDAYPSEVIDLRIGPECAKNFAGFVR